MAQPTALEQYLLELVNNERAQAGAQPLASNNALNTAAENHSQWMIDADVFSHTGAGGSDAGARMTAAGYAFAPSTWANAENIAWESTRGPDGYQDEVTDLNTSLMNSSEHRANLLNGDLKEIGLGVKVGDFQGWQGAFVTEDFARSGTGSFLTGVAYKDANGNHAYDAGEGLSGVVVDVTNAAGVHVQATTMDAGGYNLSLAPGTYDVHFGNGSGATVAQTVTIGATNVKLDAADPNFSSGASAAPGAAAQPGAAATTSPVAASDGPAAADTVAGPAVVDTATAEATPAPSDATPSQTTEPQHVESAPTAVVTDVAVATSPTAPVEPVHAADTTTAPSATTTVSTEGAVTSQPAASAEPAPVADATTSPTGFTATTGTDAAQATAGSAAAVVGSSSSAPAVFEATSGGGQADAPYEAAGRHGSCHGGGGDWSSLASDNGGHHFHHQGWSYWDWGH